MKKMKNFAAGIIVASIFGQNLAMAYDSSKFNSLSPEAQKARSLFRDRIGTMSEQAKLKLSYRLYKKVFKLLPKLEKMSEVEFDNRLNSKVKSTPVENSTEEGLTLEDMGGVIPNANEIESITPASVPLNSVKHAELTESVRNVYEQIGYNENAQGNRQPLTETQFVEKIRQLNAANRSVQNRAVASIADFGDVLDVILEILIYVVIAGIIVGLILAFGWMGVAIVLGCALITIIVALACVFSGFGSGLMGR